MRKLFKKVISLGMLLLLGLASRGYAQNNPKTFSFTPTLGVYEFDHHEQLETGALVGLRLGYALTSRWSLEGVIQYVPTESKSNVNSNELSALLYHVDALYHFKLSEKIVPFLAAGAGSITIDQKPDGADTNLMFNYGVGLKYFFDKNGALRGDIRQVLVDNTHTEHNMEYSIGLEFFWGGGDQKPTHASAGAPALNDSDGDGVPDSRDFCQNTPAGVVVDQDGCPVDSDQDGVPDYLDQCPDTPAGLITDKNGCTLDTDQDGVPDSRDFCADTPLGVAVDEKGCPLPTAQDGDQDGDGVFDKDDQCPDTPAGAVVDKTGCPLDSDVDGVFDGIDRCPGTSAGVAVDKTGCPLDITEKTTTKSHIEFDTNRATIKPAFFGEVERIAAYLNQFPEVTIEIEGHTDNTGSDQINVPLSAARANSLKKALVERHGIDPSRLTTKGYSSTQPIADNNTAEGREKNRRVVVTLRPPK